MGRGLGRTWYTVGYAWIVAYIALVLGYRGTAQVIAVLAIMPDLVYLLRYPGSWAWWILFDLVPVLAMAAFHEDAPSVARRNWLLALPVSFVLVAVPVIAVQASGNASWLDQPGLFCILVTLACLAHALVVRAHQNADSGQWSLTLILLAAATGIYQVVSLAAYQHRLAAGVTELLVMAAAVAVDGHSLIAAWRPLDMRRPARPLALLGIAIAVIALAAPAAGIRAPRPAGGRRDRARQRRRSSSRRWPVNPRHRRAAVRLATQGSPSLALMIQACASTQTARR